MRDFNLKLINWNDDIPNLMVESLQGHAEHFKDEVNRGIAQLWEVDNGETYFISRTERDNQNRKQFVVCCYEGQEIRAVYKLIEKSCINLGYSSIRFHTHRKGMERFGQYHGFKLLVDRGFEKVFIKNLHH